MKRFALPFALAKAFSFRYSKDKTDGRLQRASWNGGIWSICMTSCRATCAPCSNRLAQTSDAIQGPMPWVYSVAAPQTCGMLS